ncbi:YciE/YciF ferroxidase family protein [Natrialba asiatica]|uniref:Uncharacterized protein n=1 Tax=Natrialba asiatica (strain ATCC 700177 / DSM 12278 / JCM 9576 / FERM P-10747 / NBRC 102637 / 172P1) TaxID=29540 RepID=M0AVS1_NATA1|nr:DUF892 family protein [Natrialba asiatica]ELZ02635.1 hypothetical protein C481_08206 [Natrialba asiatica DSM 12278]
MSTHEDDIRNAADLFVYELEAAYDMEIRLVEALADMAETATNDNLRKGFAIHRTETERQVEHLETVFEALGREPTRRENRVVVGLLTERARFDDLAGGRDDALTNSYYLTAATKTELIEIATYEGLLLIAEQAALADDVTDPIERIVGQETKTLRKLRGLAGDSGYEVLRDAVTGA